jgi:hypothetical protein
MIQSRQKLRLALEPVETIGVVGEMVRQNLQSDITL